MVQRGSHAQSGTFSILPNPAWPPYPADCDNVSPQRCQHCTNSGLHKEIDRNKLNSEINCRWKKMRPANLQNWLRSPSHNRAGEPLRDNKHRVAEILEPSYSLAPLPRMDC